MARARILDVCDEVRRLLGEKMMPAADAAARVYAPTERVAEPPTEKRLRVFPAAYGDAERVSRSRVVKEYKVAVEVDETYRPAASADPNGAVPIPWVDDRVSWVEANVFDLLNETGVRQGDRLLGTFYPQTCEVDLVYDPVELDLNKTFRSRVVVTYRGQDQG